MNQQLLKFFGGLGSQTPDVNPSFGLDTDNLTGDLLDKDGNVVSDDDYFTKKKYKQSSDQPYQTPSVWDSFLKPQVAEEANQANFEAMDAPRKANMQRGISRGLVSQDLGTLRSLLPEGYDDDSLITLLHGDTSAQNLASVRQQLAGMKLGNPELGAQATHSDELDRNATSLNDYSGQMERSRLNLPVLEQRQNSRDLFNKETQSDILRDTQSYLRAGNYPHIAADATIADATLGAARDNATLPNVPLYEQSHVADAVGNIATRPFLTQSLTDEAEAQRHGYEQSVGNRTYTDRALRNNAILSLASSQHGPVGSPFSVNVKDNGTLQLGGNPLGMSDAQAKLASVKNLESSMNGGMEVVEVGGKKYGRVVNPNPVVDPLNPTATPSIQPRPVGAEANGGKLVQPDGQKVTSELKSPKLSVMELEDALKNLGVLHDEDFTIRTGRSLHRVEPETEKTIMKSKLPAIRELVSKQRNPMAYRPLLEALNSL